MKQITQAIIDRYNERQDRVKCYVPQVGNDIVTCKIKDASAFPAKLCDFLTNPEYGAMNAIFGEELVCPGCGFSDCESKGHAVKWLNVLHNWPISWKYHMQQMVISEDWIKYIEDHL